MILLSKGASIDSKDMDEEQPIDKAVRAGHKDLVQTLKLRGASSKVNPETIQPFQIMATIAFVGSSCTGKTSILQQFLSNQFSENTEPTIGSSLYTKSFTLASLTFKLEICDIAGDIRYRSIAPVYYRKSRIIFVVFDVSNRSSFDDAKVWVHELVLSLQPHTIIVLAANKVDKKEGRQVPNIEGSTYAKNRGLLYFELSAKSGANITEMFGAAIKNYHNVISRFSKAPLPFPQKTKSLKSLPPVPCYFHDLRTGRHSSFNHDLYASSLDPVGRKGYLTKQGHFMKNWKKRFFVLKSEFLYYYRTAIDPKPAGSINLWNCRVEATTAVQFGFTIASQISTHESYCLFADSEKEMNSWIQAINQSCNEMFSRRMQWYICIGKSIDDYVMSKTASTKLDESCVKLEMIAMVEGRTVSLRHPGWFNSTWLNYPFKVPLRVLKDLLSENSFLITDNQQLRIFLTGMPGSGKLINYLNQTLPPSTIFGSMSSKEYFENLNIAYQAACDRLQVPLCKKFVDEIVRNYDNSAPRTPVKVESINLNEIKIMTQDIETILYSLSFYPYCISLSLRQVDLNDTGLHILLTELGERTWVENLDISMNSFGQGTANDFVNFFKKSKTLKSINLSSNALGSSCVGKIFESLTYNSTLTHIDVGSTFTDDTVINSLIKMLEINNSLSSLSVAQNDLTDLSGNLILRSLLTNMSLTKLDVSETGLSEVLISKFTPCLERNSKLTSPKKSPPMHKLSI
eukprot:TRINITY_DN679_c0_g1_i1.p1 TRINITY_DN679_c0_g1~~TRINITY_DN679_c0_g1_i1.p1  ORF type:complete len:742 (+),score=86.98 TRINITY_DN679_c0_g1_i1:535-2760(+)